MVLHTLFVLCNLIPLVLSPSLEGFSYDDGGEITSITRRSTQKKCLSLHCSEHFHIFYLFSLVKSIVYTNFTNEHNLCSNKVLFFSLFFFYFSITRAGREIRSVPVRVRIENERRKFFLQHPRFSVREKMVLARSFRESSLWKLECYWRRCESESIAKPHGGQT